jgi:protein-tyrosine phosphatase
MIKPLQARLAELFLYQNISSWSKGLAVWLIPSSATQNTHMTAPHIHIVFFCMGNICRSPTAHGVFRQRVVQAGLQDLVCIDSAGTHNYHPGKAPDTRTLRHALKRGYDLSDLRARQLVDDDFEQAHLLLGMDWDNMALAEAMAPQHALRKVRRLTEFCQHQSDPVVPDPYYGAEPDFERVLDLVEDACDGLLVHVQKRLATLS